MPLSFFRWVVTGLAPQWDWKAESIVGSPISSTFQEDPVPWHLSKFYSVVANFEVVSNKIHYIPPYSSYYEDAMKKTYSDSQKRHQERGLQLCKHHNLLRDWYGEESRSRSPVRLRVEEPTFLSLS